MDSKIKRPVLLFVISLVVALLCTYFLSGYNLNVSQYYVLFLLFFSVLLWLTEAVPPYSVGLLIIGYLAYTLGYEKFNESAIDVHMFTTTLSSSVIWLLLGGFFLASSLTKVKLDTDLIRITLKLCGLKVSNLLLGIMLITTIISMLISNTATTAMVLTSIFPIVRKLGKNSNTSKALLLSIPIAATTGGMGTLIGSPPNAIAANALMESGISLDFVTWMIYGFPISILLTLLGWLVLCRKFVLFKELIPDKITSKNKNGEEPVNSRDRLIVIFVLLVTLVLWLTNHWHGLSASSVSAVPLVILPLTSILKAEDIRAMSWDTLILVAGGISLGLALQQTGLVELLASEFTRLSLGEWTFYLVFAYICMLFSNIISNSATATILIPLGLAVLPNHQVEICLIIGLAGSTALFLPISTPPNAIIYSIGYISQKDFRLGGSWIGLFGPILITIWVVLISYLL